ncbi:MAG: hypothetical protein AAGA62_14365, partial [Bacteroidota bacterium]
MSLKKLNFKTDILPFIIATVGEFIALYFWLHHLDLDQFFWANAILWIGFAIERTAVYLWIQYVYRQREKTLNLPVPPRKPLYVLIFRLFIITLSEVLIWIVWLQLADGKVTWLAAPTFMTNFLIAGAVLMVLMLIEHSIEIGALRNKPLLQHVTNPKTILFTFMEVAGAMGWLYFVRH